MARIRTIKPEFWGHPKTARVSRDARLLFLGLFNESDDEGRQLGSPKKIAGAVFPNDDDVAAEMILEWLEELEQALLVHRYWVDGVSYVLIDGFKQHQKVSHPAESRLPAPPANLRRLSGEPPESLAPDLGIDLGPRNRDLGSGSATAARESPKRARVPWAALGMSRADWKAAGEPMPDGYEEPALAIVEGA